MAERKTRAKRGEAQSPKTSYVILHIPARAGGDGEAPDGTEIAVIVARDVQAHGEPTAIKQYLATLDASTIEAGDEWVAVPTRSWRPRKPTVEILPPKITF